MPLPHGAHAAQDQQREDEEKTGIDEVCNIVWGVDSLESAGAGINADAAATAAPARVGAASFFRSHCEVAVARFSGMPLGEKGSKD